MSRVLLSVKVDGKDEKSLISCSVRVALVALLDVVVAVVDIDFIWNSNGGGRYGGGVGGNEDIGDDGAEEDDGIDGTNVALILWIGDEGSVDGASSLII